jgi:4-amino-4-deoxy-L-arabinose transferase-like glycosyltransferase
VNDTPATSSPSVPDSLTVKITWVILLVATLGICYFSHLGALGFVGPDEPRYAWIARAMAETGDWVTPRLYGQPWFEKPVLYYWGAALSFKIFGVSEAAARLPSALSALLATLALAWLALRVYGAATARWLLLLLPTTVGMIGFSHAAATDMSFSGMLTLAMVCAPVILGLTRNDTTPILPRTPWLALLLFGFFLGLAVLAKGPAAIILSGGAVFFWAIFTKRWRDAFRLLHPVAILALCATALPWYISCARRNPDFFRIFIIEHNFKRYLTPEFQHIQPFWFYVPVLLVAFLPWIALFLWPAVSGLERTIRLRNVSDFGRFLVCWAGFCVLFFSISHSKLPGYILPALPAIGLLMARTAVSQHGNRARYLRYAHLAAAGIFLLLFGLAELFAKNAISGRAAKGVGLLLGLFALANLILGIFGFTAESEANMAETGRERAAGLRGLRPALQQCAVLPVLVAMMFANDLMRPLFRWDPSGRTIAREVQRLRIPTTSLGVNGMNRAMQYSLSFYLHEEVKSWDPRSETGGYLLTSSQNCERVVGPDYFCEEQPFDSAKTGRFLYLVIPLAHGN